MRLRKPAPTRCDVRCAQGVQRTSPINRGPHQEDVDQRGCAPGHGVSIGQPVATTATQKVATLSALGLKPMAIHHTEGDYIVGLGIAKPLATQEVTVSLASGLRSQSATPSRRPNLLAMATQKATMLSALGLTTVGNVATQKVTLYCRPWDDNRWRHAMQKATMLLTSG